MDKRIIKTILLLIGVGLTSLFIPMFGQWYEQQTGICPIGFYAIMGFGGLITTILTALKIWGEIK